VVARRAAAVALASSCLAFIAQAAQAQVSGRLGVESDFRNRGVSPSDTHAAVILDLAYDRSDGLYAAGSLVGQDREGHGAEVVGHSEFVGFARRDAAGRSWDIGVSNTDMTAHGYSRLRYSEVYAGVSSGPLSARAHYSPNYLEKGQDLLYLELDGAIHPAPAWRVGAHVGAFAPFGNQATPFRLRRRYDVKLSLVREFTRGEVHVSWQRAFPVAAGQYDRFRGRLGVGASVFF
jgi:uncharacterized protein (TIGR02001 family)